MIAPAYAGAVHALFEFLALGTGVQLYRLQRRREGAALLQGSNFWVALGCVFGAAIGNKAVFWAEFPHLLPLYWNRPEVWFAGQSMVGGLLGGLLGVEAAKKATGLRRSTGDTFVVPVLVGLMIGRVGCFLAGLSDGTYGVATPLPWGVDFGDGIPRHPTQLYEIGFAALLLWGLHRLAPRLAPVPGLRFKFMLCAYLLWRLLIDGLKPVPFDVLWGLSGIQVVCLVALLLYGPCLLRDIRALRRGGAVQCRPLQTY